MTVPTTTLTKTPSLAPLLARGAALSPLKRGVHAGAALPGTRLVLPAARTDDARLSAYSGICGFPAGDALPLPYPHILGFPLAMRLMADRAFPLPLLGLVHTRIGIARHGRVLVRDDRPELAVYAERLVAHRRGTEVVVVTEARLEGELVWESRSSYLARHRTTDDGPRESSPAGTAPLPAVARWEVPGDLGRRYGAASGDRNPIHLHPLTAKLFGFPRAIAHGMWTFARCLAEAERTAGPADRARAEFKAPVLLPADVTYAARTTAEGTAFELRGADRVHLTGEAVSGEAVSGGTSARPA
ncbi:MaoC/PaaZ C-terminal domain-containing protein [Streptomyces sp. NPDC003023]|uniref:MaoC/PaaZ C-terminal domain-containing protein n=1 Tax=Streptomyces sp. NPDC003023 TaxID=3364675 RepID=UPI0036C983F7